LHSFERRGSNDLADSRILLWRQNEIEDCAE